MFSSWYRVLLISLVSFGCNAGTTTTFGPGDGGTPYTPAPGSNVEACDQVDNNGNGLVDEGCACTAGEVQACSFVEGGRRKRGICADGMQRCVATSVEFATWGPCEGGLNAAPEIPGDCIDQDCDGVAEGCPHPCVEFEVCGNGIDDDCNGKTDCEDPLCDCDTPTNPDDGDDGGFEWPDLSDIPEEWFQPPSTCTERCVPGTSRWCDEPVFCYWGTQDCGPDGSWGACVEVDAPAACEDPFDPFGLDDGDQYNPGCCVAQGLCCQNFGYDPTMDIDASVGSCTGIVTEQTCN